MCCAGFGVTLVLFALSKSFWLSVLLLLPAGYFIMLQMAASNTLIQVMVPDELRGRTMAVYSMMFMGMTNRRAAWRRALGPPRGSLDGGDRRNCFSSRRVVVQRATTQNPRGSAKTCIIAQSMAGGEPAEEMAAPVVED